MRGLDAPRAERDGADDNPGTRFQQAERVECGGAANDVGNRVQRTDLVQVDLLQILPVDRSLGRAQETEDVTGEGGYGWRKGRCGDEGQHVANGARRGCCVNLNVCLEGSKSMPTGRAGADLDWFDVQCFDCRCHRLNRCAGVEQCAQQHVAGRASGRIDPDATAAVCHGHLLARMRNSFVRQSAESGTGWPGTQDAATAPMM